MSGVTGGGVVMTGAVGRTDVVAGGGRTGVAVGAGTAGDVGVDGSMGGGATSYPSVIFRPRTITTAAIIRVIIISSPSIDVT